MVVLARVLVGRADRLLNVAAAMLTALFIVGGGDLAKPHYLFLAALELVALALIARSALAATRPAAAVAAPAVAAIG